MTAPRSLRSALTAGATRSALLGLGLAAFYGVNAAVGHPVSTDGTARLDLVPSAPQTAAERMVAAHDCVDAGPLPDHVVATTADGRLVFGGPRLVHVALEQLYGHHPAGLTIHAFCAS